MSTRSASTSKILGLSFKEIEKPPGWSNETTFAQFYDGQFQRIFKTIYLDEMCRFLYVYMVLLILETYMVLIIHETILIRLRKILDY